MTTYMLTQLIKWNYAVLNWTIVQLNCDMYSAHEPENKQPGIMIVQRRLECRCVYYINVYSISISGFQTILMCYKHINICYIVECKYFDADLNMQ